MYSPPFLIHNKNQRKQGKMRSCTKMNKGWKGLMEGHCSYPHTNQPSGRPNILDLRGLQPDIHTFVEVFLGIFAFLSVVTTPCVYASLPLLISWQAVFFNWECSVISDFNFNVFQRSGGRLNREASVQSIKKKQNGGF